MNDFFSAITHRVRTTFEQQNTIPKKAELKAAYASFSPTNRKALLIATILATLALIVGLLSINESSLTTIATSGGTITEGIISSPRFINPILASYDSDRDVTALIYSGLIRKNSDGAFIPDLARDYTISEDGKRYTVVLKSDLTWHDGEPLTARDVAFTVAKAQDPLIKSPRRATWEGVTVDTPDDQTVVFTLTEAYAGFLDTLTMGIIPEHIWKDITPENFALSEYNTEPIGSGPYAIKNIKRDSTGVPEYYTLEPFADFALGKARVDITIMIYPNETERLAAYKAGIIDTIAAISPEVARDNVDTNSTIITTTLPRVFAVFFNQNQAQIFTNKEVRLALGTALNKQELVTTVLEGYGTPLDGPTLSNKSARDTRTEEQALTEARQILEEAGWAKNEQGIYQKTNSKTKSVTTLSFSLATSNAPELKQAAEMIATRWKKLGAAVELEIFENGTLQQTIIRPRKYDTLLFGQVVGQNHDLFAFWHSSQRLDPGLNIAQYANVSVDKWLDEAKSGIDPESRRQSEEKAIAEITKDMPAIFLYAPNFIYVVPAELKNLSIGTLQTTADRFLMFHETYIKTERIWKIFARQTSTIY